MSKKVALFCTNFLPWSQTFVYEELQHHVRYEAEVFANQRLNEDRFPFENVTLGGRFYTLTRRSKAFEKRFEQESFDVVHGHFGPGSIYALHYAERYHLPLLCTFHGYDVPLLRSDKRFRPEFLRYGLLGKRLLNRLTLALCASTELREMVIEMGVPAERAICWRLGIDLSRFHPVEKKPSKSLDLLCIGRFVEKKGFEVALRGFAHALHRGLDGHLTLIGDGPLMGRLKKVRADLDLGQKITFAGTMTQAELASRLQSADALLAPSVTASDGDRESGLIVVKEASASGVVPLSTWHGGIPEIVEDGVTGFLVPERDAESLGERLLLLQDGELRAKLAKAARQKMEREYDIRDRIAALEQYYDEAIERFGREG